MNKKTMAFIVMFIISLGILIAEETGAASATVPMALDHNRITIMLEMQRPDGTWKKGTAWWWI